MTLVIQNTFDGGQAEDIRTHSTNQCAESLNFDLYTNPHKLLPIRDNIAETVVDADMDDIQIADVLTSTIAGNTYMNAIGYESAISPKPTFYNRTSNTMNGAWTAQAVGTNTYAQGSGVLYKGFAYAMSTNGALQKYVSAGTVSTVGTTSGTGSYPRPFVHPEDNVLYIVWGNVIARYDGSSFTTHTSILPSGMICTSLTDYGTYLAIAMKPAIGIGNSTVFLWGRDTTKNTLQGQIDFGDCSLNVVENLGDVLVGLAYPKDVFSLSTINKKLDVKVYSGGSVTIVKSIPITQTNYNLLKLKKDDKLYFSIGGAATAIWAVYKNKKGYWTVNKERYIDTGSTSTTDLVTSIYGLSAIGDYIYVGFVNVGNDKKLMATSSSETYNNVSIYKTTINPSMPLADRYKDKQLEAIQVAYTGKTNGTITVKYSVDGSTLTKVIDDTTTAAEEVKEATMESADSAPLLSGREFQFQIECTKGVEIKEIRYRYNVIPTTV